MKRRDSPPIGSDVQGARHRKCPRKSMKLIPEIVASADMIRAFRRHLHARPELGYDVHGTSQFVAERLSEWGIEVTRGIGKTGVVGTLRRGRSTRAIGLRADMDALPIEEANTFEHRSQHAGMMHACGHDGHTSMLLGAARHLALEGDFDGVVHFIFQPAEEGLAGGRAMVQDGLFDRFPCEAIFGVHNWPGLPVGHIGSRPGPLMAASATFEVIVTGIGSHAAMPHASADALLAASQIVVALQSIVSRNVDPIDSAVLSVCKINGGRADNVIAKDCRLSGAVRTFDDSLLRNIGKRIEEVAQSVAKAFGCDALVEFRLAYPATVNDPDMAAFAMDVAQSVVGRDNVSRAIRQTMAGEDFAFMLKECRGCYAFIGNGDGSHREPGSGMGPCELHNDSYDFNDELLPIGATYFVQLANRYLKDGARSSSDAS